MTMERFSGDYACSFKVGDTMGEQSLCLRPATKLVTWDTDFSNVKVMTYCRSHWKSVETFSNHATDITDLVPDEC